MLSFRPQWPNYIFILRILNHTVIMVISRLLRRMRKSKQLDGSHLETSMLTAQVFASIAPMIASIMLAVFACIQHQWMMLAMIIPSIVMYMASLIPQCINLRAAKHAMRDSKNIQVSKNFPADTPTQRHITPIPDKHKNNDVLYLLAHNSLSTNTPKNETSTLLWKRVIASWLSHEHDIGMLRAPIGITSNGIMQIDLIRDGPHALIAGTTGSGKSVLLTSWCLSLAFQYSPQQLHFVFIDFKGGATFNTLATLPHSVGSVGDLNISYTIRALRALEQELHRREKLVALHHCHEIHQLDSPEPLLVIIIDEFYALREQLPEYMDRLIHIASLGRSLGMHLIACTQNPLGQVNTDMKANMSLNICLRVRDALQSQELLGSACAAYIPAQDPGSAYCMVNETITGIRCATCTQSDHLITSIQLAGIFIHQKRTPQLFTPPLPKMVHYDQLIQHEYKSTTLSNQRILIGYQDDGVRLHPAYIPINAGNIAIIGSTGRGKTALLTLLQEQMNIPLYDAQRDDTIFYQDTPDTQDQTCAMQRKQAYLIDNADALLEPFSQSNTALTFQRLLSTPTTQIIMSLHSARYLRIPDQAPIRVIFPTGDATTDAMLGIPNTLQQTFTTEEYQCPGRAVLVISGSAFLIQIALCDRITQHK